VAVGVTPAPDGKFIVLWRSGSVSICKPVGIALSCSHFHMPSY